MTTILKKHYKGCYRVVNNTDLFGQIIKNKYTWEAEIRYTQSGNIRQFSGIWDTLKDAIEEVSRIIEREGA